MGTYTSGGVSCYLNPRKEGRKCSVKGGRTRWRFNSSARDPRCSLVTRKERKLSHGKTLAGYAVSFEPKEGDKPALSREGGEAREGEAS